MAHNARIAALTDELVRCITAYDPTVSATIIRTLKDASLKTLRTHRFGRTNQFAVQQHLDGLLERAYVNNNEPLAEALESRLVELETRERDARRGVTIIRRGTDVDSRIIDTKLKWRPEILALLLALSERPIGRSTVEDLQKIRPVTPPREKMSWRDIVGDEGIARDMKWGRDSEDDQEAYGEDEWSEGSESERSEATQETRASSLEEHDAASNLEALFEAVDSGSGALNALEKEQRWRSTFATTANPVQITEPQLIREVVHALYGLPTTIFFTDARTGTLTIRQGYTLSTLSIPLLHSYLAPIAAFSTKLSHLRTYTRRPHTLPLLQTLASCIEVNLRTFALLLTRIEAPLAHPSGPTIVSLLDLQLQVETAAGPLSALYAIVIAAQRLESAASYQILDTLHDAAAEAHLVNDAPVYKVLRDTFHACLVTYLRPVRAWMETGDVPPTDSLFFVQQTADGTDTHAMANFWGARFRLKTERSPIANSATAAAPRLFAPFVHPIFAAGKQAAFLRALGIASASAATPQPLSQSDDLRLLHHDSTDPAPFADAVRAALDAWVGRVVGPRHSQTTLKRYLLHGTTAGAARASLTRTLAALQAVYLAGNGVAFAAFAEGLSALLLLPSGRGKRWDIWDVEGVVKEAFTRGENGVVEIEALSAQLDGRMVQARDEKDEESERARREIESKKGLKALGRVRVAYTVSPVLHNIIRPAQIHVYQSIQTFLLQLHRATSCLSRLSLRRHYHTHHATATAEDKLTLSVRWLLLHYATLIHSHISHAGISTALAHLDADMSAAIGIDGLIRAHERFVARLRRSCLLVEAVQGAKTAVLALCDLCVGFALLLDGESERTQLPVGQGLSDDSEDDEEGILDESAAVPADGRVASTPARLDLQRLRQMHKQAAHVVGLIIAGLRSASRESRTDGSDRPLGGGSRLDDGSLSWGMLAEELEVSVVGRQKGKW